MLATTVRPRRPRLLGAGVLALLMFGGLTVLVATNSGPMARFDTSVHSDLMGFGSDHPAWLTAMRVITRGGDTLTIALIHVVLVVVCLAARRRLLAAVAAALGIGGWAARVAVRDLLARPRPADAFWPEVSFSFPSGHTTNTTVMVAMVLLVSWAWLRPAGRFVAVTGGAGYALAVGVSRVAGGVHWPTDVFGGLLLGSGLAAVAAGLIPERFLRRSTPAGTER